MTLFGVHLETAWDWAGFLLGGLLGLALIASNFDHWSSRRECERAGRCLAPQGWPCRHGRG